MSADNPNSKCSRCGAAFTCGLTAGHAACWCAALPHVLPLVPAEGSCGGCFCPECLRAAIDARERLKSEGMQAGDCRP